MTTSTTAPKTDVYSIITDRITSALAAGNIPWRKPWRAGGADVARNGITHRAYQGINVLLLAYSPYTSNRWVTFKQAQSVGTAPKKGEHGVPVVYWKVGEYEKVDETTGKVEKKKSFLLRYSTVFNKEQLIDPDALPKKRGGDIVETVDATPDWDAVAAAESILAGYDNAPSIAHVVGDKAFYSPDLDAINLPARAQFEEAGEYYSTLFHELAHSTGHESRIGRHEPCHAPFGTPVYAKEELVAELGSAFLCAHAGIDNTLANSAAYIQGWLRALQNDHKLIVEASSAAQKAARWILGDDADAE